MCKDKNKRIVDDREGGLGKDSLATPNRKEQRRCTDFSSWE
jgi:hypothetical protein